MFAVQFFQLCYMFENASIKMLGKITNTYKIVGIRVYVKRFTNKSDIGCDDKSKMTSSLGS